MGDNESEAEWARIAYDGIINVMNQMQEIKAGMKADADRARETEQRTTENGEHKP